MPVLPLITFRSLSSLEPLPSVPMRVFFDAESTSMPPNEFAIAELPVEFVPI